MAHDQKSVEEFFGRVAEAWKTNDAALVASFFTDDGSLINPFGERADGRDAVSGMYANYFTGMLKGSSTTVKISSVRAVGDDHVFADGEQAVNGPDGQVVLEAHIAALLRRDGDSWRFVDSRPYIIPPPPG